ncbi:hypothetical protein PYW08_015542 [Mythimna loreyi]|uniref:Uncharacterized protein n=1 Tax=Mythimna loreyi TaxID=667449 RepID=A0ACC2QVW9_9NEOP|nr:hypothetical protein PYW08_015542 [Mythimna loreyi]
MTMKAVIFLIAIGTAIATLGPADKVPTMLEHATPADVLLYLYDVVLMSHTSKSLNEQGSSLRTPKCPEHMTRTASGCVQSGVTNDGVYDILYDEHTQAPESKH